MARLRVGTSGWSYREWRGLVYPARLPSSRWLAHYTGLFDTVEVNASFYRLLKRSDTLALLPAGRRYAKRCTRNKRIPPRVK